MSAESNPKIQWFYREPQAISSWNLVAAFGSANVLGALCILTPKAGQPVLPVEGKSFPQRIS